MKRVLITGASGFIGRAVTQRLACEPGFRVYAVISGRRDVSLGDNVTVIKTDLLRTEQASRLMGGVKADLCVHLAWELPGNDEFQSSTKNLSWLQASLHILQQFAEYGGKRFVFAGSSSEYGVWENRPDESLHSPARSLYGASKRAFTETAQIFAAEQGIEFACARYFSIYGEYDVRPARAVPYAIQQLLAGGEIVCRSPNSVWDYLYVGDAAEATCRLAKSGLTGAVNIGSGIPRSMSEVFETIAGLCGRPRSVAYRNQEKSGQILVADIDRLRHDLGFRPAVDFESGLLRTISWWKGRGQSGGAVPVR